MGKRKHTDRGLWAGEVVALPTHICAAPPARLGAEGGGGAAQLPRGCHCPGGCCRRYHNGRRPSPFRCRSRPHSSSLAPPSPRPRHSRHLPPRRLRRLHGHLHSPPATPFATSPSVPTLSTLGLWTHSSAPTRGTLCDTQMPARPREGSHGWQK